MLTALLFLILGFVLLIFGADWLVAGSSSLAKRMGMSAIVIGLTVVSMGTSAPEMTVSVIAALNNKPELTIGNVVGSNIVNILLILGVSAIICPLVVKRNTVKKEVPLAFLAIIIMAAMANDVAFGASESSVISRNDGVVLLGFLCIFLAYTVGISKAENGGVEQIQQRSLKWSLLRITVGVTALVVGGAWIVESSILIAKTFGISEAVIGLTIVAIGTSLPELATSAMACYRGQCDIAIGNVVGSNILNVFWILGTSAVIAPLPFQHALNRDVMVAVVATGALYISLHTGRGYVLNRTHGILFVFGYAVYLFILIKS